jgi:hypothetical protein
LYGLESHNKALSSVSPAIESAVIITRKPMQSESTPAAAAADNAAGYSSEKPMAFPGAKQHQ